MALTDTKVRNAKPANKPIKIFDVKGLFLLVTPAPPFRFGTNPNRVGATRKNTLESGAEALFRVEKRASGRQMGKTTHEPITSPFAVMQKPK